MTQDHAVNVKDFGHSIIDAIRSGANHIHIPAGRYVTPPLRLPSNTHITADPGAEIVFADHAGEGHADHLLCNADPIQGNENISVQGGLWDGNNPSNPRGPDYVQGAHSGVPISFINVKRLTIKDLRITDPDAYYIRIGEVSDFLIEDIRFEVKHLRPNQDGIHMGGYCANGVIRRLIAEGPKKPSDDMVAFVADDIMDLSPNMGLKRGPFKSITVDHLRADDCHSFIRLGSVFHEIRDVTIRDVKGGCRVSVINGDALRYCMGPVFDPDDPQYVTGVGLLSDITLEDFEIHKTEDTPLPLFMIESRLRNFVLKNVTRNRSLDTALDQPLLRLKHVQTDTLQINGQTHPPTDPRQAVIYDEPTLDSFIVQDSLVEPGALVPGEQSDVF